MMKTPRGRGAGGVYNAIKAQRKCSCLVKRGRGGQGEGVGGQGGREGGGQTLPTIVVSTIDYTSPEKTAKRQSCLLHARTRKRQQLATHRLKV